MGKDRAAFVTWYHGERDWWFAAVCLSARMLMSFSMALKPAWYFFVSFFLAFVSRRFNASRHSRLIQGNPDVSVSGVEELEMSPMWSFAFGRMGDGPVQGVAVWRLLE